MINGRSVESIVRHVTAMHIQHITLGAVVLVFLNATGCSTSSSGPTAKSVQPPPQTKQEEQFAVARLGYAVNWMAAFSSYASKHEGRCPKTFEEAAPYFPQQGTVENGLTPDQFEIVFQGSLTEIKEPANVIVIRQKRGWQVGGGGWRKTYGFADGHSEIRAEPDGKFERWEARHGLKE